MRLACLGLSSWIEKKATIVLPSRLLAGVAYQQFTLQQLSSGHESWERPSIMSIGAWLTSCWHEVHYQYQDISALLSPSQEHLLWKKVIQHETVDLFDVNATARMAARAARILAEWEIPAEGAPWNDGSDAPQFERWFKLFSQTCRREGWISLSSLWQRLPEWISHRACAGSWETVFPLTEPAFPALRRVFAELGERALISPMTAIPQTGAAPAKSFDAFSDELDFAARWARHEFERDPSKSIGVLVPDLAAHRTLVDRAFLQVFYPGACRALVDKRLQSASNESRAFHANSPPPLSAEPIVSGALLLLRLAQSRIPISDAGAIVRSPWLPGETIERTLRARADIELRKRRELDVSLHNIELVSSHCPQLAKIWKQVRRAVERKRPLDTFAGWSEFIGDLLQSAGWPGDQGLGIAEQNAIETWKNALSQLSALSLVAGEVSFEDAISELNGILRAGFEQGSLQAPIQIFDSSQASGLEFDAALLAGLSEEMWPPMSFGSPFLPVKLQREHKVPGSSPQSLRLERQRMSAAIFAVAPNLVATFSGRPSPLINGLVSISTELNSWTGKTAWESYKPVLLEECDDSLAPCYRPATNTRGGTSIIKAQSLCPFRAFAEFRLQASSPEEGCLGFDSRERGGNLHQALQLVWQKLLTRDRLRATPQAELEKLVECAAAESVTRSRSSSFGEIVASVELERLKSVILDWLAVERERQQNFTVETVEQERYFDLAGLRLRLRLDRVDRLSGDQLLLIDYKSGEQTARKLEGDRPEEPQLFVYASSLEEDVAGLFFGQVKPREPRLKGISKTRQVAGNGNQVRRDWDVFLLEGKKKVYRLAEQFKNGYAAVDPLKGACDYCAQKSFCRIHEARKEEGSEE